MEKKNTLVIGFSKASYSYDCLTDFFYDLNEDSDNGNHMMRTYYVFSVEI